MKALNKEFGEDLLRKLKHETPFFLFSKKKIIKNLKKFKKSFPGSTVYYAMKANSEPEILKIVAEAGDGFEVASKYELDMLRPLKVAPNKIIYGTSVKPVEHIKEFFDYGVDKYAFDSLNELEKIAAVAPGVKVYARMVVNDSGSVFKFSEKFGTDKANIASLLLHARELGLVPYGISFHVGSQASDFRAWANALENINPIMKELKEKDIEIKIIDFGGGYPCRYGSSENAPTVEEISEYTMKEFKKLPYQPKIILEPGRGIIADASVLATSVIARVERQGNNWLFLDVGVYNGLFETMAYQGSTRYSVTTLRRVDNAGEGLFSLAGPTGDSPDILLREALLPQDIDVGDKIIFHNVGAYSLSVASRFNGFPKPKVYVV
jgi:ornithine decarboxylase